ncbi:MAG: magnesium transporter [Eubacterium sp.]|nr:magnesium transporter [Eubacterium sp.]
MDNYAIDIDQQIEESLDKILDLLVEKQYFRARDELLKYNEADIAEMLEDIIDDSGIQMAVILFRLLPKDVSVEVFAELPSDDQIDIIQEISDKEIAYIIDEMDFDDKIDVLEELPANIVDRILYETPKSERKRINTFLNYAEDSAGSLMTPEYISLQKQWTVREALEHIKKEGMEAETIYTCYVKDTGRKLIGIVSLAKLVITDDDVRVMDIMVTDYVYEHVDDDQEEVADDFKKYGYLALPVVDKEHRLVGIITFDDIMDVMEDEATEDIERMNGVIDFQDSDAGYLDISVLHHAMNRLPWLIILMIAYIFTGRIVTSFEASLSQVIELVAFMPMLMGTGGNTGSQAATLIIRGLATDEVDTDDALRVLWKELRIGMIIGVTLSVVNYARIWYIDGIHDTGIALTVCVSMIFIVIFAKIIGSMIPLIVKKIHLDPALIANPAISSVSDAVALSIYFAMATLFLPI